MIIHGGYAKRLREGEQINFNDIDLLCTQSTLDQFCSMLSDQDYVIGRPGCAMPSRELVILAPRKSAKPVIKFDIEIINENLHTSLLNLADTSKVDFIGMTVGVVSAITDMLIKEACDFDNPKHLEDAKIYREAVGEIDFQQYAEFTQLWKKHISGKYDMLAQQGLYDPISKKLRDTFGAT